MLFIIAVALLVSHLLADFYLQPSEWIRKKFEYKHKSWHLYAHSLIAGVLAYLVALFTGHISAWWIVFAVAVPHFLIDLWKTNQNGNVQYFILDQCFHLINLLAVYILLINKNLIEMIEKEVLIDVGIIIVAILILWKPTGILIGQLTKKYRAELEDEDKTKSLPDAGQAIGILERLFILIVILLHQFSAIGFLIAAKSILRYSDHQKVKNPIRMSEYIIIGTLMSFIVGIAVSLACRYLLTLDLF